MNKPRNIAHMLAVQRHKLANDTTDEGEGTGEGTTGCSCYSRSDTNVLTCFDIYANCPFY